MIKVEIKKLPNSQVEITGEIPAEQFEKERSHAVEEFQSELEIPGFRKGHAPENLVLEKVGEEKILFEMAEHALSHVYPEILEENKLDAIGRPEITITKIAKDNPLGFKIVTSVLPEFKLPDYKKIAKTELAKKEEKTEASDEEINQVLEEIRKNRAVKPEEGKEPELPELNDEFAKSLGQFESVSDLKSKIKENVSLDKQRRAKEKKRLEIMEAVIGKTEIELPPALIENELHKMSHEMRTQLESMGLKYEDYLSHLKKTEDDLKKDWEPEAIKRVKFGLILSAISKEEKIVPKAEDLEREVNHTLEHYKDADPERVREYISNVLVNEEVFKFLENQK